MFRRAGDRWWLFSGYRRRAFHIQCTRQYSRSYPKGPEVNMVRSMSTISDASIATSLPLPIAMPMSAAFKLGASFTPSPWRSESCSGGILSFRQRSSVSGILWQSVTFAQALSSQTQFLHTGITNISIEREALPVPIVCRSFPEYLFQSMLLIYRFFWYLLDRIAWLDPSLPELNLLCHRPFGSWRCHIDVL